MIVELCEHCGKKISIKMARASESHCQGLALCIRCHEAWLDNEVEEGRYPTKMAEFRQKCLQTYLPKGADR